MSGLGLAQVRPLLQGWNDDWVLCDSRRVSVTVQMCQDRWEGH